MGTSAEKEYAAFEEKVKKTIYIDNLSHRVTKSVLENALNQFGNVTNIQFIPNDFTSCNVAALVEMESTKKAEEIIREMSDFPLMISGMPRPVRAQKAKVGMFEDRPKKVQREIKCYWMDPNNQNLEVANKIKHLTKKHAAEATYMMELQHAKEEKLHQQQSDTLKANYKKYELIDGAQADGTVKHLAACYGTKLNDY